VAVAMLQGELEYRKGTFVFREFLSLFFFSFFTGFSDFSGNFASAFDILRKAVVLDDR
jgi:hypothetical protein